MTFIGVARLKYLCVINSAFKAFKNLQSLLIIVQVVP